MKRSIYSFLFFLIPGICLHSMLCPAQVITSNDGFEGTPAQGTPPPHWNNCNDGLSSGDTQPGFFNNYAPASQGQTYISLVTRELNPPGTAETVWAYLLMPFEINKTDSFKIDLSLSHDFYGTMNWTDYYFDNPCVLQIIGFNGDCNTPLESEVLWQSDILANYSWQTFDIKVTPALAGYQKIAFRPNFSTPGIYKNSAVFIDNLRSDMAPNVVYIPNIFSPNGDGINDNFCVRGENISQVDLKIYNRWGNLVFETQDKSEAWSGRTKNADCQDGVYYYVAKITFADGETVLKKGSVTLVR